MTRRVPALVAVGLVLLLGVASAGIADPIPPAEETFGEVDRSLDERGQRGGAPPNATAPRRPAVAVPGFGSLVLPFALPAGTLGTLALLVALAGIGAAALAVLREEPPEEVDRVASEEADATDAEAVAAAAGRAADRLADDRDAAVDNAVYDAWREMTEPLDVERPEASTPGEFAAAAVDAGLDREDVAELTELFEAVRYGGADAAVHRDAARSVFESVQVADGEAGDTDEPAAPADRESGDGAPEGGERQ